MRPYVFLANFEDFFGGSSASGLFNDPSYMTF